MTGTQAPTNAPEVHDYFAELYVAGCFADAGWNVYFPHRDAGFDFIVSRPHPDIGQLIRPVPQPNPPGNGPGDPVFLKAAARGTDMCCIYAAEARSHPSPRIPLRTGGVRQRSRFTAP